MAVDKNAIDIRNGNDFSHKTAIKELAKFDLYDINSPITSPGRESGVVTMTNLDYFLTKVHPTDETLTTLPDDSKMTTIKKTDIGPAHAFEVNTRPPLAGPYAFSRIPKPFWNRPRIHVMEDVEDTWLFLNVSSGNEGRTTIRKRLPESLDSWILSGFSLDSVTGLGLLRTQKSIDSFRSFQINTDLPYSIKRGEILAVRFVVTNNFVQDLNVEVKLHNTEQDFDFVKGSNDMKNRPRQDAVQLDYIPSILPVIYINNKVVRAGQVAGTSSYSLSFLPKYDINKLMRKQHLKTLLLFKKKSFLMKSITMVVTVLRFAS